MKLVYIAGPYRAKTTWDIACNIHEARVLGAAVAVLGAYPVIPHSNTAHFDGLGSDEMWLDGTLELMRRCDAVVFSKRWTESQGSKAEHAEAVRLGIEIFAEAHLAGGAFAKWLEAESKVRQAPRSNASMNSAPLPETLNALSAEIVRAREKFPGNRFLLTALMEEVGELATAYLQREPVESICKEALQVACVALRIYEEGDRVYADITDAESKP